MTTISTNNKRIAKNTLFLYFRMLFMMAISLYTSRVVLDKLGVTDFGIYNVVSGIVVMLGFLSGCMSNSVQRFLSFEMGRNNQERVNRVFNVSLMAHGGIALFVLTIMECVGLWYLNTHMNIPSERMGAANWVFQFAIVTFLFTLLTIPFTATVIAHEHMNFFAYLSIVECITKLGIALCLPFMTGDYLIAYSIMICILQLLILTTYIIYCYKSFSESKQIRLKLLLQTLWDI